MTTRTAVELTTEVLAICEDMIVDSKRGVGEVVLAQKYATRMNLVDDAVKALDAEVTAMRARLAAMEAFADEVRKSAKENVGGGYEPYDAGVFIGEVRDALAKLPVKP